MDLITICIRNWKLIVLAIAAIALLSVGIWFRGVIADRATQAVTIEAQAQQVIDLNGEVERMNIQDALDFSLRQDIEAAKMQLSEDMAENQRKLKRVKDLLDEKMRNHLDVPLPQSYLDGLPQNKDPLRP